MEEELFVALELLVDVFPPYWPWSPVLVISFLHIASMVAADRDFGIVYS